MMLLFPATIYFNHTESDKIANPSPEYFNFQLTQSSRISISGTSNVNEFICLAYQDYAQGRGILEKNESNRHIIFQHTSIQIPVKSLSCDNQVMDYDMYQALKSDVYPYITLDLKEAYTSGGQKIDLTKQSPIIVKAELSIAGVRKMQTIQINAVHSANGQLICRGNHKINLSDFNIDPPTALFGVIKVRELVQINFDLSVVVN